MYLKGFGLKLTKFRLKNLFKNFYPHEESHEGLGATVLQFQTYAKVLKI